MERKSKWWIKVFYRYLDIAIHNAWILFDDAKRGSSKSMLSFKIQLASQLIERGRLHMSAKFHQRISTGCHPPKHPLQVDHLPAYSVKRRRCCGCSSKGITTHKTNV